MRSHVVLAVFKRNFWSYFSGVIGYLFIVAFVFLGASAAFQEKFFTNNLANLEQLNEIFPQLLLFIVPAITMGVWSEERKLGTEELLFTLPVSNFEVLIGKYLAVVAVYTVALAFSLSHTVILEWIGEPDWSQLIANYFGYWLAGAAMLSIGMVASYLTASSTVAFVLGGLFCAIPVFIGLVPTPGWLATLVGTDRLFDQLSLPWQFRDFGIGLITLRGVLYFVSIIALMLYLNLVLIGERHWKGGEQGANMSFQYAVRFLSMAAILIGLNSLLASRANPTLDLTAERVFSVTPTTTKMLQELDGKRPVLIQAFVSDEVPREYVSVKSTLLGLLDQYASQSRGHVTVRTEKVVSASPQADEAKKLGIEGRKVQTDRAGRLSLDEVYLGAVISSGANEVVIPFFDVGLPIEYELTRSVKTVASQKRKTIGILETDAKINGGFDMGSMRSQPEWRIVSELKKQYEVEAVPANAKIDGSKFDVLMAVLPSSLGPNEMTNLVDYVKTGKPVLILDDPLPATNPQLAPRQPKPRGGNPMMAMQMPPEPKADGGKATALVNELGIQWIYDQVVFDYTVMALHPEYADLLRPEIVSISPKSGLATAFNPNSPVTSGLQEMFLFFSGTIRPREGSKLDFKPLLRTGKKSGLLDWNDFVKTNPFMGGMQIEDDPRRPLDDDAHVIAAEITSGKDSGDAKINVIYVADADLISDWFFMTRERKQFHLNLDNVTFILNAVDHLAGDNAYIDLRKRRLKQRTLTEIEKRTEAFLEQSNRERQKAGDEAKAALDKAKERLSEKVEKIKKAEDVDDMTRMQQVLVAQSEEQRKVEVEEQNINQKKERIIEKSKNQTNALVRQVERLYYYGSLLFSPVPAILLGFFVWMMRIQTEYRDVSPTRRKPGT